MELAIDPDMVANRARCADKALFALNNMIGNGNIDFAELKRILEGKE